MQDGPPVSILFVCMGNICRSPIAEAAFRHRAAARGVGDRFLVDSSGTGGWHAGSPPDPRAQAVARRHGIEVSGAARQVTSDDFERFDHIVCMDEENRLTVLERGAPPDRVHLLLELDPSAPIIEVPDPYYAGPDGFETAFRLIDSACGALLERLLVDPDGR